MEQKFVIRLMDKDGVMLGWCEEHLRGKEGSFKAEVSEIDIVAAGIAHHIHVHWCDLDVVRTEPLATGPIDIPAEKIGSKAKFFWTFKSVWLVKGKREEHLPPVAVKKPIVLAPPPAAMGAVPGVGGKLTV